MKTNMGSSIQDYFKKINRWLTWTDIFSLGVSFLFLCFLVVFLSKEEKSKDMGILYKEGDSLAYISKSNDVRPFGSINGTTYTFSWCQGGNKILEKNKIFFSSEVEAKSKGRRLSKLCQK